MADGVATLERPLPASAGETQHFDVLIVGAGISGIGSAYHLQTQCPGATYTILETQESFGGTWLTHKYPGIRSDSDLYTFGYRFKPWVGAPIASAEEILRYMREVIDDNDLERHVRYGHKVLTASWSTTDNLWTIESERLSDGTRTTVTANFLWMCQGYYRHAEGYTPAWPGMDRYKGRIVHPQTWPGDLDYRGKRIIVIGSGATAATVVPAIAQDAAHVTVVQRSPTYFIPGRNANDLADTLRELQIDEAWIHEIVRRKILFDQDTFTRRCLEETETVTQELLGMVAAFLPEEQVKQHFTPRYRPWRQRIAFVPDGDLFQGLASGKASMATGEIECFTENGLSLTSGEQIDGDIIVTATGFNLNVLGDIDFTIDGQPLNFADTVTYRGMMFSGVPNMVWVFGYFRASWTLRTDMVADFFCRLLNHMKAVGAKRVEVVPPEDMPLGPWIEPENFNPGYLMRGLHLMPKAGDRPEWRHTQDYWWEKDEFPKIDLAGPAFKYGP
jgi:cation diffusion facilitator CzcD-associated flavoprotein CzcO